MEAPDDVFGMVWLVRESMAYGGLKLLDHDGPQGLFFKPGHLGTQLGRALVDQAEDGGEGTGVTAGNTV